MKLSIVVPMYNVELYIQKWLLSCLKQDISSNDYEIIVVNDGSIDDSLLLAEKISSQSSNIFIISQANEGLSVARNTGLTYSRGEYVWFIDSDDWIEENCLGAIIQTLDKTKPDFLQLQYRTAYDDQALNKGYFCLINDVVSGQQQINNCGVPIPAQFAIYRREFLQENQLYFYPHIFHEDCEFKPRALFLAKRCASYDQIVYNYYQRSSGSITSHLNPKRAFDYLKGAISVHNFYIKNAIGKSDKFFNNYLSMIINNAFSQVGNESYAFSKEFKKCSYLVGHLKKSSVFKYKLEGWLFSICPLKSVQIYNFLNKFKQLFNK